MVEHDRIDPALAVLLAAELRPLAPEPQRRQRMRAHVLAAVQPGAQVRRADDGTWLPYLPGIDVKHLRVDAHTQTSLWRLQAGAVIPAHGHGQDEECLVLAGELLQHGQRYGAGDYLHVAAGVEHAPFESPLGALLLIRGERRGPRADVAGGAY